MKLRPLQGQVLIRLDQPAELSEGGIIISEQHRDQATTGVVVRCGIWRQNGRGNLIPFPVGPNDKVVISKYRGRQVTESDRRLKLVDMNDVLAVFEEIS